MSIVPIYLAICTLCAWRKRKEQQKQKEDRRKAVHTTW
jgi:hypothetical protein